MRFVPVLAAIVTALGLYATRGVLDQVQTADGPVRVALLPPWQTLAGFVGVGILGLAWLQRRTRPRTTTVMTQLTIGPLILPTLALLLLVGPYLPVLPDLFPPLQTLAGPLGLVVWVIVLAQLLWTLGRARVIQLDWPQRFDRRQLTVGVALATMLICGGAAARLIDSVLYPGGDEPHYLVIAQSLWRDGDLKIENNHTRGDYYEYYRLELAPHYLTRGADGEIYSIHPIGMPVLMTPVFAAGGYHAVVAAFVLMAALAAALMWYNALTLTDAMGAATFGWAAVVATAPFLFNSFAIYPEIPAALAVAIAFTLIAVSTSPHAWRWLTIGIACAALPWLSTKYAPMSAALVVIAIGRLFAGGPAAPGLPRARGAGAFALLTPYALSLLAWFYFFYAFWGVPLPQAPYGALVQTSVRYLIFGAPGLLFDQEYGLLPYAPVYLLAGTGLVIMFRADAASRRRAIEIVIVFGALLATVGAFRIWWGGSASPGRPLTSGLLLLAIPIAYAFGHAAAHTARRAMQHVLLWSSIGIAGILLFAQQGLLLANGRDGTSALLEHISPRWAAWTMVPSFIHHEAGTALAHTMVWVLLALGAGAAIRRVRTTDAGTASIAVLSITTTTLVVAAVVMPSLPFSPAWPAFDLRARARLPILDDFDAKARPLAIEYSPFRFTSPAELITHSSVMAEPHLRTQPQPIRVLHNGRFSLPAGTYRIEIEWSGERLGDQVGLQIGRTGDPLLHWPVDARPGERWTQQFSVPVDAPFVGLRGTPELERVIASVRIIPIAIVNATDRLRGPAVIAASQSGPASLFYYDTYASPEIDGFWVWGGQRTRVTLSRPPSDDPLVLRVHSGPVPNRLHVAKFGWRHSVDLPPEAPEIVEVPLEGATTVTLEFAADAAFVPRELDPSSTDARALGVWVEVIK
jgi:hypothetical protein